MKLYTRLSFFTLFLLAFTGLKARLYRGKSFFLPKSQSLNLARHMVGRARDLVGHHCCIDADLFVTPFYGRSFRPDVIANYFFGTDTLSIQGSTQITATTENDLLADSFGLSTGYEGSVRVMPFVSNGGVEFGTHAFYERWYFTLHAPLVWAHTRFQLLEMTNQSGAETLYPAGYMANEAIPAPTNSFKCALEGVTWGNITTPLQFGKLQCDKTVRGIADVRLYTGYRVYQSCRGYVGLDFRLAAPTGNTPDLEFLFEPIVGNGHHWECGVGMLAGSFIWSEHEEHWSCWNLQISVTHLFSDRQLRSFDLFSNENLCDFTSSRPLSRYILAKEFETQQYTGNTQPLINKTTLPVDVTIPVQFDLALMFSWWFYGCEIDLGYEVWARSSESLDTACNNFDNNTFGLKGIANVTNGAGTLVNNTQSTATIQGNPLSGQAIVIDNPSPVLITTAQLNPVTAKAGAGFLNKLFAHATYHWDRCYASPTIGIGGEVEFDDGIGYLDLQEDKNSLNQWSVWLKAGMYF